MRRRAHPKRLEQEAKPLPLLLRRDLEDVEDLRLQLRLVDPQRAAAELLPVADEVVRHRERRAGVGVEQRLGFRRRPGERMVLRRPAPLVFRPLEHREVGDPDEAPGVAFDQLELLAEVLADRAENARHHRRRVRAEEHCRARLSGERGKLGLGEELQDRRARLTVLAVDDVREALRAPLFRKLLEVGKVGPRELLRHGQAAHRGGAGEHLELRAARRFGHVADLEPEAQVGLVGAVAEHRVGVGHARERRLELDADRLPHRRDHRLHQAEDELDVRERHLDVELGQLLNTVGAEVLVAEAAGDLEVALEAGDDEQLLEDLR